MRCSDASELADGTLLEGKGTPYIVREPVILQRLDILVGNFAWSVGTRVACSRIPTAYIMICNS